MNNIVLVGRLTKKPEMSMIAKTCTPVAKFTLDVEREYNRKEVDFLDIQVFGKRAESCEKYLDKGNLVSVTGSLRIDKYKNKNDEYRTSVAVRANSIQFIYTGKKNDNGELSSGVLATEPDDNMFEDVGQAPVFETIDDDDVPF